MSVVFRLLLKYAVIAIALYAALRFVDGLTFDGDTLAFLTITAVFWLINSLLRPVVKLLSLPLIILTFGLFTLVINIGLFWLTIWLSDVWGLGLHSAGPVPTIIGAVVVGVVSTALNWLVD
ncbi:MAG: phage holin family protein [Anaerolineae bacterium]